MALIGQMLLQFSLGRVPEGVRLGLLDFDLDPGRGFPAIHGNILKG